VFIENASIREAVTKMHEDLCVLPVGEAGRILDRLLLLEQVIGPEQVRQVLEDTECFDSRRCRLTRAVIFWVVLAMGLLTDLPIRQVFKYARRLRPGEATPHRSSLCLARQRLGLAPLRCLFERVVRLLATAQTPGAFYQGWRLMALDGTVYTVPDSPANATAFGRPSGGTRGEGAFPQVRKLSLVEVGTHVEVAFVAKGIKGPDSSEQRLAPGLFRHLRPDMLLVWDRGFFSYALWKGIMTAGCQLLARVSSRLVLRPTQPLADGSYLAKLYPCESERNRDRQGILVRVIRYTLNDPQRVGHGVEHVLLTTLLDAERYPAEELVLLYHERWEIELVYDEQKTHQNPWRVTKSADLRSQTPVGVLQELYALSIGHFVVRSVMTQAATTEGLDPDRLSFVGCLQILRCRLPECPDPASAGFAEWYRGLLWEVSRERTDDAVRRNRSNPRVVKVKMSKFKKKRPEHRPVPPLLKTFTESVVMLC
jgi:Insertion element 4 transposase N-terminal/Transposase DDE domain